MKKIFIVFITVAYFVACKSSSKKLEQGNYDAALQKSAKKIRKNPSKNANEVYVFNDAYRIAMQRDNEAIDRLKRQGDPANWSKIYHMYVKMNKRQDLAISLPPVGIEFEERNFHPDINDAKLKATEYAYGKGNQLLNMGNRFDARKAHARFLEVKSYDPYYKDVNSKLSEALFRGKTNIFFKIADNSNVVAPQGLIQEVQRINISEIDEQWKAYTTNVDSNLIYHYSIILNLKLIDVTPEEVKETNYTETREVDDGFDYVLDANGNVAKDSLGNDLKIPRVKVISCHVRELHQRKTARISGSIDYFDNLTNKLMKSEPVTSDANFEHHYAIANGDLNALQPVTRQKLGIDPIPFPEDEILILQAGDVLKKMTKDIVVRNRGFLQ